MKEERMGFRKFFSVLLMVAMVCSLAIPAPMDVQAAGSASNNKNTTVKATVKVTETVTLRVKNPTRRVKWSVDKPKIAKITKTKGNKNSTAIIKGMKIGKATVTAKIGQKKRKVIVTVKQHKHFVATFATCTQPAKCGCGYAFGAALGHQMVSATCKEPQRCSRCGITTGGPAAHSYNSDNRCIWCNQLNPTVKPHTHFVATPATCTQPAKCECGYTFGAALGHQMAPATCEEPQRCSICGYTFGAALGHQMVPATCEEPQKCSICGYTAGEAAEHSYGSDSRCIWCNQLNLKDFVGFQVSRTANDGCYYVNYIYFEVANVGNVSFEVLTSRPANIYPSAGASGIRVYLTDADDQVYTDAYRFVVSPGYYSIGYFDTLGSSTFTFAPDGVLEFYASYGEHTYLFRVNASKQNAEGVYYYSDYTFTQVD